MAKALPLRIFLASPSGLEGEREVVRSCVKTHNQRRRPTSNVAYEIVEGDRVRGTARRPQEAINELIAESHFMVVLFKREWGSEPGGSWGYTSGTEEELFTGLLELGQAEQPMRDLWVAFIDDETPHQRILDLRTQMEERHSMMYESLTDLDDLRTKLDLRLRSWEDVADTKTPLHIDLLPSSGNDVLKAARLRIQGEKAIEIGQPEAGHLALKEAAELGGPAELIAYARSLRHRGDLDGARDAAQKATDYFVNGRDLYSTLAAESVSQLALVLRLQGNHDDAIGRLENALTLLVANDSYALTIRCRILDDLGLAHQKAGDFPRARANFEAGLRLRQESGRKIGVCQSWINLARLTLYAGDTEAADAYTDALMADLQGAPRSALHANADVLVAQIRLKQSRAEEGIPYANRALALNRQIGNLHSEAISLLTLARCFRALSRNDEARAHAQQCIAVNRAAGNNRGEKEAQSVLNSLPGRSGAAPSDLDLIAVAGNLDVTEAWPQERSETP